MIYLIILALAIWAIARFCAAMTKRNAEKQKAKQIARIKEEKRIAALEKEQMRQAKELEKHEAMLKKHDEEIAKLNFKVEQATSDIEYFTEQISSLYALLDIAENQRMMAVPGSKADETAQKKIVSLNNRIRTAEKKLDKAKFDKEQAERKLA